MFIIKSNFVQGPIALTSIKETEQLEQLKEEGKIKTATIEQLRKLIISTYIS